MAQSRIRLDGIESLRAYAAVAIIFFHLIGSGGATVPESLGFIKTHFGFGVPLFFVVSGFSLAYGYFGRLDGKELSTYFLRRFARIAPLFYAVLVFQLFNVWFEDGVTFSPLDVAMNGLFVFNLIPHLADGIVPASWTIGVEMLFYALFPLALFACRDTKRTILVLALSIVVSTGITVDLKPFENVYAGFVYHNIVAQLPYFIWGILFFHIHRSVEVSARQARLIAGRCASRVLPASTPCTPAAACTCSFGAVALGRRGTCCGAFLSACCVSPWRSIRHASCPIP